MRLADLRTISDPLTSLADRDDQPIRKDKPQHLTLFGHTALVPEDEHGSIVDHQVRRGNPPTRRTWLPRWSEPRR